MTRVLVVEDEPALARALGITLRARRYEVEVALTGAAALDVAPSTYMRYLIRIPVSACPDLKGSRVLVVDAKTLGALRYELVRWGRHYNQGVHALNAIAYAARRKAPERDYFVQQIGIATDKLDAVEEGRRRLEGRLDELEGSIVVGDGPCRY